MVVVHGLKDVSKDDDDGPAGDGIPQEAMQRIDGEKQSKEGPGGLCVIPRGDVPTNRPALNPRRARVAAVPAATTRSKSARCARCTR